MGKKISRENFANPIVDPLIPHYPLKQPIQLRICTLCDITVQGSFQSAVRSSVCYCRTSLTLLPVYCKPEPPPTNKF